MSTLFYFQIEAREATAAARVNDIPVWRGEGVEMEGAGVCLNGLLKGDDRLDIVGAWPRGAEPGDGRLTFTLGGYAPGDIVGVDGDPILSDEILDATPDPRIAYQRRIATPVDNRWAWMDAPPVDAGVPGAVAFVEQIADAFRRGDAETVLGAMGPLLGDRPRAFPDDNVEAYIARLREAITLPAFAGAPVPTPGEMVLRPAADGRLMEPLDRDGAPYIRKTLRGGEFYPLPILIGRHGPDWAIYR